MTQAMQNELLKMIRESEELGVGSCSIIDECYNDEELLEEIRESYEDSPDYSVERMFQEFVRMEGLKWEHEREVSIGYGGW